MTDTADHVNTFGKIEGGLRPFDKFRKHSQPNQPLITVITVVRNGCQLLDKTINNVLNQTYGNIEYIIVDGASTDGTLEIIKRYDGRLAYWISEPDKGLYDAMNKGIDLALGDWINFMNAGDTFYALDTVQRVMQGNHEDADLVYGHCQMVYENGFSLIWKSLTTDRLWKGMICRHQSVFTRSAICKKIHFDLRYAISADFAFLYSCYNLKKRFFRLDLIVSSITLGGYSDINLVQAFQDNRRIVIRHENSIKVRIYYGYRILLFRVKTIIKWFLPAHLTDRIRMLKYE